MYSKIFAFQFKPNVRTSHQNHDFDRSKKWHVTNNRAGTDSAWDALPNGLVSEVLTLQPSLGSLFRISPSLRARLNIMNGHAESISLRDWIWSF